MDYYAIIIKLGVLTWKDAHDASFNVKKKKKEEYHTKHDSIF